MSSMLSMLPEERKIFTIDPHVRSIVCIFNLDKMSNVRSDLKSWTREIIWDERNILVDPEGWNVIDQDGFSWFLSCSSEFNYFQLKRVIGERKLSLERNQTI